MEQIGKETLYQFTIIANYFFEIGANSLNIFIIIFWLINYSNSLKPILTETNTTSTAVKSIIARVGKIFIFKKFPNHKPCNFVELFPRLKEK